MTEGSDTDADERDLPTVTCRIDGTEYTGSAIAVSAGIDPARIATAVLDGHDFENSVTVDARRPPEVYEYVGLVRSGMGLRTRTALAAAGRSLGLSTPYDEQLRRSRAALDELSEPEETDTTDRKAQAVAARETERLREKVATLRGRLLARRENDLDTTETAAALADAIGELSEAETRVAASTQAVEQARSAARKRREAYERRFELEDRIANLERDARAYLVADCREPFSRALQKLPGSDPPSDPFEADPVMAALAIVRIAHTPAPVVLDCTSPLESPTMAANWLGAPVIWIE